MATTIVVALPAAIVWALGATGTITSPSALIALGVAITLAVGYASRLRWESRSGSGDLVFEELMIWGFVRRWRAERQISSTMTLLGRSDREGAVEGLGRKRRAELLADLASALDAQDPYTHRHSRRVARHSATTAKKMGLPRDQVSTVRAAAAIHDVGKIDTPAAILQYPGRLSEEEFSVVKGHAMRGAEMVCPVDESLALIIAHHHERVDGNGYPGGISGESIPVGSRIIAVADTFDAITSKRPYRDSRPHRVALETLRREAGTQFDPAAVSAFRSNYSGFRPLAVWAVISSWPESLLGPLVGRFPVAGASPIAKVLVTATAITTMAGAIVTSPQIQGQSSSVKSAPAAGGVSAPSSARQSAHGHKAAQPAGGSGPGGGHGAGAASGAALPGAANGAAGTIGGGTGGGAGSVNNPGQTLNGTIKGVGNAAHGVLGGVGSTANGATSGVGNAANGALGGVGNTVTGGLGGKLGGK